MALDLESLRGEIDGFFVQSALTPFHSISHFNGTLETEHIYWDTKREPDFRVFLRAAERAGIRLIVINQEQFLLDEIDDVRDQLEATSLTRDEKRNLERRIQELQKYEGFTSRLELSFSLEGRVYVFHVEADWYSTWDDIMLEIDAATAEDSSDLDDDGMSGYFSAN
jgi:hypothetical protein